MLKSRATPRRVSNVGDLVPLSHLDHVGASTPVISAKAEYESCKKFSLAAIDELDNNTIQSICNALTPELIVTCLLRQRCLLLENVTQHYSQGPGYQYFYGRTSNGKGTRCSRCLWSGLFIFTALLRGQVHNEYIQLFG